jgi:hypothetical protein
MITWIVEETKYHNDNNVAQRLLYVLEELGCRAVSFKYIPFGGTDWGFLKDINEPAVFFGSWNVVNDIRARGIQYPEPFIWCDIDCLKCTTYYQKYGSNIVQEVLRISELRNLDDSVFTDLESVFIRPDDNDKIFNGSLVARQEFGAWKRHTLEFTDARPDTLCIVGKPVSIKKEWRFLIVDGRVVDGSLYKKATHIEIAEGYEEGAAEFAERMANIWAPRPVFIMDIGKIAESYKIVEIGPFNYAGLYRMDLRKVVGAINNSIAVRLIVAPLNL